MHVLLAMLNTPSIKNQLKMLNESQLPHYFIFYDNNSHAVCFARLYPSKMSLISATPEIQLRILIIAQGWIQKF